MTTPAPEVGAPGSFWMGQQSHRVPFSLHSENRARLIKRFTSAGDIPANSFILLEGGDTASIMKYDTDGERVFRQESFFQWAFGVIDADCYGVIDVDRKTATLFIPKLPEDYAVWMGKILPPSSFKEQYEVDEARFTDDLETFFAEKKPSTIYMIGGTNTDSGANFKLAKFKGIEKFKTDVERLYPDFAECRVFKSEKEIEILRYVNRVSSDAHKLVMSKVRPGLSEFQLESVFLHHCYFEGGCRNASYTCICGTGNNSSILHYGHASAANTRIIKDGDMCLFDMGTEYHCYCADITCSFPANGKFTADQKIVYNAVLKAQRTVEATMKPGVKWPDMHRLAERCILEDLSAAGLLQNGTIDDFVKANLASFFMPHGLGHFLGLDTHDVGGYPKGVVKSTEPGLKKLRTGRTLEAGMVITVEPGCYFIDVLLDQLLANKDLAKYVNQDVLKRFRGFGGVRLEDDVVVTASGIENLTTVPRTVEEIEAFMAKRA